jgi:hypothetical protein
MNWRQIIVLMAGIGVSLACLSGLVIPHPEWQSMNRTYQLGPSSFLIVAPMEGLCFALLLAVAPLTVAGVVVLADRKPGREP